MKFIDQARVFLASGSGGPGCVSFRREAMVPRGGPDGGDGGRGGHIYFQVDPQKHSLLDFSFKKKYRAEDGEAGKPQNRHGRDGADIILKIPPGTLLKTAEGRVLRDFGAESELFLFLEGGLGGRGNPFYKSSVNQAPSVAQHGLPGQEAEVLLELKLLADVGLVGLPNAGKSTLISVISAARPKVADYPFTTLEPQLGVVKANADQSFVVADLPGLIEGASKGVGLGLQFLRHIERTRVIVHLVDGSEEVTPVEDAFATIQKELSQYDEDQREVEGFKPLMGRPIVVCLTKCDRLDTEARLKVAKRLKKITQDLPLLIISSVTQEGIKDLINLLAQKVFAQPEPSRG